LAGCTYLIWHIGGIFTVEPTRWDVFLQRYIIQGTALTGLKGQALDRSHAG